MIEITDEMIEAACKVRHSPPAWGRAKKNPTLAAWVESHRTEMRDILEASFAARNKHAGK